MCLLKVWYNLKVKSWRFYLYIFAPHGPPSDMQVTLDTTYLCHGLILVEEVQNKLMFDQFYTSSESLVILNTTG